MSSTCPVVYSSHFTILGRVARSWGAFQEGTRCPQHHAFTQKWGHWGPSLPFKRFFFLPSRHHAHLFSKAEQAQGTTDQMPCMTPLQAVKLQFGERVCAVLTHSLVSRHKWPLLRYHTCLHSKSQMYALKIRHRLPHSDAAHVSLASHRWPLVGCQHLPAFQTMNLLLGRQCVWHLLQLVAASLPPVRIKGPSRWSADQMLPPISWRAF